MEKTRSCGKVRFSSFDAAKRRAEKILLQSGYPLRVYYCTPCRGYHLTKSDAIRWWQNMKEDRRGASRS